ncbi:Protein HID1 [Trichinella pseudospiralis]
MKNGFRKLQLLQSYKKLSYHQQLIALWWKRCNEAPEVGYNVEKCNVPRNKWKIGRIIEIYPGNDGIARTTKLRTSTGITKRSTAKLYLIEPAVPN